MGGAPAKTTPLELPQAIPAGRPVAGRQTEL